MIDHQLMVVISHAVSNHDFAWGGCQWLLQVQFAFIFEKYPRDEGHLTYIR